RLSPDLIPAAVMAARSYLQKREKKNASRVLKKAWEAKPHPDIAAAFAEIEPEETPAQRIKRFRTLTAIHPENSETQQLLAELLIAAEEFPAARRAIGDLAVKHPTQRALAIMAAVERGEGSDDATVRAWLAKALTAPRGPQWCCDKCQAIHASWRPICENCGGFDTLTWREPVEVSGPSATGAELLSLYIAGPKPPASEPDSETTVDEKPMVR
ncbi:MAG: heme biosynthesis protein HemY, partial [Candidatus Saccharibacteria bacterium]|nr:heme biosynthesis protein HemY [Pseudorhodobacter sp.]